MKLQADMTHRCVAVENLRAMCEQASGTAHRFWVDKVTRSRVHVGYSNPDEFGVESPVYAVFPCYPLQSGRPDGNDNPLVVLDFLRVIDQDDTHHGEAWQCFEPIVSGPKLWRDAQGQWATEDEILRHHASLAVVA